VPTPEHSGPDTSHSGRTQKAGPSSSAAAAAGFVPGPGPAAAVVVLRHGLQQAPVLELVVVAVAVAAAVVAAAVVAAAAAPHPASVHEAAFERGAETGPGAAVGSAVTLGVTVVGLEAAAGSVADPEFELVPAEGEEPLLVGAVPGDSTMPSNCLAPDMAAHTPSGVAAGGPVVLVVKEAVLGVEAAIVILALPHKKHCDLGLRGGLDAAVYRQAKHLGARHILADRIHSCSIHTLAAGQRVDHK
jgi:hypothetical protein